MPQKTLDTGKLPAFAKRLRMGKHKMPADLKEALAGDKKALAVWEDITPLAKNEWICWVTSAKLEETRKRRIAVGRSKLKSGMRRPCCWAGCPHR